MTFMQARTANEVKAQERRVRLLRMKGELVDRAKAVAQVFRLARDERDAWVNWPARVAASRAVQTLVRGRTLLKIGSRLTRLRAGRRKAAPRSRRAVGRPSTVPAF
jgi:hypothetical protein